MAEEINKTYLSLDNAEERGFIHRDYIAHCLRWSHVIKRLGEKHTYKNAVILDLGCGKEVPLAKTLYTSKMSPHAYFAVDAGLIPITPVLEKIAQKTHLYLHPNTRAETFGVTANFYDTVVCFEVLEHVKKDVAIQILDRIKYLLHLDGTAFISTPCYNGSQANNHIYEWTYQELKDALEERFLIKGHWGTFASIKDYQTKLSMSQAEMFHQLREYYDTNYLATIFAPLFPEASRNVLWEVGHV
jgi:2-polyprenyl-3-methyl-5-hydroxy-6-metoxy-1,4-benzoquinol methylase